MTKQFKSIPKKFNSTKPRFVSADKFKLFSQAEGFERIDTFIGTYNGMTYYTDTAPEELEDEQEHFPQAVLYLNRREKHLFNLAVLSVLAVAFAGLLGYAAHLLKTIG